MLRYLNVELAPSGTTPDLVYSYDVREFKGRDVTLRYPSVDEKALEQLTFNNNEVNDPKAYEGPHRPRFHFSPRLGWMNDVNGSYYFDGLYHVFYQFNPTNPRSGAGFDMHWGHSVSKDLVHWEEWPIALFPDGTGQCYSGTAIVAQKPIPALIDKAPGAGVDLRGYGTFFPTPGDHRGRRTDLAALRGKSRGAAHGRWRPRPESRLARTFAALRHGALCRRAGYLSVSALEGSHSLGTDKPDRGLV